MITPHPQVLAFIANRGADPDAWVDGMRKYRRSILNEKGRVDFGKIIAG